MADETPAELLAEIRDLLREQGARQAQALEVQRMSFELQQRAVASQSSAVQLQRRVIRVLIPLLLLALAVVLATAYLARR
ncbi:MAG TPA: hypothetical protein VFQ45_07220 [Longimicrobium sp.]|nr:hypothetical protein [Longimicrobium sp.]